MNKQTIFIITVILLLIFINYNTFEDYNMGTMIQLYAKGPQDTYLTGDAWKYIPPYYYNYNWIPYYMPTRLGKLNYHYYSPYGVYY